MWRACSKPKYYLSLLLVIIIVVLCVSYGVAYYLIPQTELVSLQQWNWSTQPQFIAIKPVEQQGINGLLLLRLADNKEQFFVGDWQVNISQQAAYVFGSPDQPGQLYRVADNQITTLNLSDAAGRIIAVSDSPNDQYGLISVVQDNGNQLFCISHWLAQSSLDCDQISVTGEVAMQWNTALEHEIVIQDKSGNLTVYDPINPGLHTIDTTDQRLAELNALFNTDSDQPAIYQFGTMAFIYNTNVSHFIHIPWRANLSFIGDTDHILVQSSTQLMVIELSTNRGAIVSTMLNLTEKEVFFPVLR